LISPSCQLSPLASLTDQLWSSSFLTSVSAQGYAVAEWGICVTGHSVAVTGQSHV